MGWRYISVNTGWRNGRKEAAVRDNRVGSGFEIHVGVALEIVGISTMITTIKEKKEARAW